MINEIYDKYLSIAHEWAHSKEVHINRGVRIYSVRNEIYTDDKFYVLGIGTSSFLEPNNYNPENDWVLKDFPNGIEQEGDEPIDVKGIVKFMCGSSKLTLGNLTDLYNQLKEAGAEEVYLHPAFYEDSHGREHIIEDEMLIVIPKKDGLE